jgi:ketosteroid isomerase-like protein
MTIVIARVETHPLRRAIEARDLDALLETFAPDVVFHSPLISEAFEGRDQVAELIRALSDVVLFRGDVRYTDELSDGDTAILVFSVNVKGRRVEGVDVLKHDHQGKIKEMTVFLRPLPGATSVAQVLSPRLAGGGNRVKGAFAGLGVRPLAALSKLFDRIGSRTVRSGRTDSG